MNQGFLVVKVKSSLIKFYGRPHNFLIRCGVSVTQMTAMFHLSLYLSCPFLIHDLSLGLFVTRITRRVQLVTGEVIAYRSGAPEFTLGI
jgi:hypothetical protein